MMENQTAGPVDIGWRVGFQSTDPPTTVLESTRLYLLGY